MRALSFSILLILSNTVLHAQSEPEGFYKLESISGDGTRQWQLTGELDGIDVTKFGTITIKDQLTEPGEVILREDGTAEASWKNRVTIRYDYQPNYYQERPWGPLPEPPFICDPYTVEKAWEDQNYYPLITGDRDLPFNELDVEFDTEGTGTWSGNVTMDLTCDSTCTVTVKYKPEDSEDLLTETFTVDITGVKVNTTGSGAPENLTFEIDMLKTFIKELTDQQLTGDREVATEDALREGEDHYEPDYPPCPALDVEGGPSGEFIDQIVKKWTYKGSKFKTRPTDGEIEAKYEQYYLLDVSAPYGFFVTGDYGTAEGLQEIEFKYGGETHRTSIESGLAEAEHLDYKDSATTIDADVLSDGAVTITLTKDLTKVDVSPWAAPASSFSSTPGVVYKRSPLDWPISVQTTRALSNASILTGLWGINGSASSKFDVSAHSEGTPQDGKLTAKAHFKVAEKEFDFSLDGEHCVTLDASGLTADGTFTTTPFTTSWRKEASILSLVPGAGPVIAALGPIGTYVSNGAGASVEAKITATPSGTYMASPSDANPRFTSGTLRVDASLTAQVNPVPKFARGVLNLNVSGGGGATMVINLAPNPAVASLTGYLNFMLNAKFFRFENNVDKEWTFGDPPAAAAFALKSRSSAKMLAAPSANALPAQTAVEIAHGPFGTSDDVIIYSEPHPTLPAPAEQIVIRYPKTVYGPGGASEEWLSRETATDDKANFAPTFARPLSIPSSEFGYFPYGVAVWAKATGPSPSDIGDLPAYLDSSELHFQYYNTSQFGGGFDPTERVLTNNMSADIGPILVQGASDTQARLFWVRTSGLDLTGSTTPVQILNRNWISFEPGAMADDPSTAWSPEVAAVSGLAHIVDWRAAAWDARNAAILLMVDADGDYATQDDIELWFARETAGTWAAPVRLTTNSVKDDAPTLLYKNATTLVMGWRQGDTVVGTFDYDTTPAPSTWFDAASEVSESWTDAILRYRSAENSLVAIWARDQGLGYTEQAYGPVAVGSAWPEPRYHSFGGGVVSAFQATFDAQSDPSEKTCNITAVTENSTTADINTVPMAADAKIRRASLTFGPEARKTTIVEVIRSHPTPHSGDDIRFAVRVESPHPLTYTWKKDGELLPHFNDRELYLYDLSSEDEGTYTVSISDGTGITELDFPVFLPRTFANWIAEKIPDGTVNLGLEDDYDFDGSKNVMEYLFDTDPNDSSDLTSGTFNRSSFPSTANVIFEISRRAVDIDYAIEFSNDMSLWTDVTGIFTTYPLNTGNNILHLLAPLDPDSRNSFENFGTFPIPFTGPSFYRLRISAEP